MVTLKPISAICGRYAKGRESKCDFARRLAVMPRLGLFEVGEAEC